MMDVATAERIIFPTAPAVREALDRAFRLRDAGDLEAAHCVLREALVAHPRSAALHFMLSGALLQGGRYAEGWPLYEARRALSDGLRPPVTATPEWRGEDPAGKKIAVCAEQGIGDQIMFGRYLPSLRARGAEIVVLGDPRKLGRFFDAAGFLYVPWWANRPFPNCDYWVPVGSLPLRLGSQAPPAACYVDRPRSPTADAPIGFMLTGNTRPEWGRNRHPPQEIATELSEFGIDLRPESTGAFDFWDTAEIISGLRLVVTVDTSIAHLAGALGVPSWVLLPYKRLDWRWNDGLRSDWYPESRLFRQPASGDWRPVAEAVRDALRQIS